MSWKTSSGFLSTSSLRKSTASLIILVSEIVRLNLKSETKTRIKLERFSTVKHEEKQEKRTSTLSTQIGINLRKKFQKITLNE